MQTISYMGNGTTTEFMFNFPYYDNTNIVVTKNNKPATEYEIIGTSNGPNADIPFSGGKVVFDAAPKASDSITITRSLPLVRIADYQPTEKINPTVLNQDLNYMIELLKDIKGEVGGSGASGGNAGVIDDELAQEVLAKINEVSQAIEDLGDISTVQDDIAALDVRTNNISDYVVASQFPTAENGYTWYRKYKSGWVEQGGTMIWNLNNTNSWTTNTAQFPQTMADCCYTPIFSIEEFPGLEQELTVTSDVRNLSSLVVGLYREHPQAITHPVYIYWVVMGLAQI